MIALSARAPVVPVDAPILATACFPGAAAEVGEARDFVRGVLGADWPAIDDVLLMVSEVASNAVRHTGSAGPDSSFDVTVSATDDTLRISVGDSGSASEPRLPFDNEEMGMPIGGRGLRIVDALSSNWGFSGDELGRVVWFEIIGKTDL
jgi:serine/threonine-protein kinase RsbW